MSAYPCVDGLAMTSEGNGVLGFVGSHSSLCNIVKPNIFEVILTRSIDHSDNKGVAEHLFDPSIS